MSSFLFTSEAVAEGHPDKVADRISDTILDAFLSQDPTARVAAETLVTTNLVVLAGETRSTFTPNYRALIRAAIADIGYANDVDPDFDAATLEIINRVHTQSAEIAQGVDAKPKFAEQEGFLPCTPGEHRKCTKTYMRSGAQEQGKKHPDSVEFGEEGAGDQGLMFGYACNDTEALMPAPIHYANHLMEALALRRKAGETRLRPDGKCQLTVIYENHKPVGLDTLVISHQHTPDITQEALKELVLETAHASLPKGWITSKTKLYVNPTGSFIQGGPGADTGLTGRKIIVDSYGGMARHGGGAFSGKDPTKVDRSAAYAARYLAKNIVAAKLAERCEIQLCYAIGVPEPLAIYLETFGTLKKGASEEKIAAWIKNNVSLTPKGIRTMLNLNRPIYAATSAYGHFGRQPCPINNTFTWERTELAKQMTAEL